MTKLYEQFELSDVGLRKICVKHQIPLPLQGHWTRKQFGKEGPQPTLTNSEFNPVIKLNDENKKQLIQEISEKKKAIKELIESLKKLKIRQQSSLKEFQEFVTRWTWP